MRAAIDALVHRLQLHHLANPERHAQFALLTDWADADTAQRAARRRRCCRSARQRIERAEPAPPGRPARRRRGAALHRAAPRARVQRDRAALDRLGAQARQARAAGRARWPTAGRPRSSTWATRRASPPARATSSRSTATRSCRPGGCASWWAWPRTRTTSRGWTPTARAVIAGYGILQPRIVTPLPAPRDFTLFHWLFAGQCGIDPYSAATSEVYQDLFGEGTLHRQGPAQRAARCTPCWRGRLPEGQVLSHDLLEGSLARCAARHRHHADRRRAVPCRRGRLARAPLDARRLAAAALPAARRRATALRAINRWKMFDNLRRSLVAPMSLALLLLALAGARAVALGGAGAGAGGVRGRAADGRGGGLVAAAATTWPSGTSTARPAPTWRARCAAGCGTSRSCCSRRCWPLDAIVRAL